MRALRRNVRGAIALEALGLVPLLAIQWVLLAYVCRFDRANIEVQRSVRNQAWIAASQTGCGDYESPVVRGIGLDSDDVFMDLRRAIAGVLGFLEPVLIDEGMGSSVSVARTIEVPRFPPLRGRVHVGAAQGLACPTRTHEWSYGDLFARVCALLGTWCP